MHFGCLQLQSSGWRPNWQRSSTHPVSSDSSFFSFLFFGHRAPPSDRPGPVKIRARAGPSRRDPADWPGAAAPMPAQLPIGKMRWKKVGWIACLAVAPRSRRLEPAWVFFLFSVLLARLASARMPEFGSEQRTLNESASKACLSLLTLS